MRVYRLIRTYRFINLHQIRNVRFSDKLLVCFLFLFTFLFFSSQTIQAQNPIPAENLLVGNLPSEWDVSNAGDPTIQGFATDISVNKGSTINFKIDVTGTNKNFSIKIYRLGYYGGRGARLKADLGNIAGIDQAPCITQPNGIIDCGNWSVSASWTVPSDAVSGIYIAKLERVDNGGSSHITFIVRDDSRNANILFKTIDATWQAYNNYGGNSLYLGSVFAFPGLASGAKVSYNRPFLTRSTKSESFLYQAEYPMLRWLERNGYDVAYSTDVDFERDATPITPSKHKIIISPGHDEYWSLNERNRIEAARNAGVHLAFFSGNEVYWKTRWENSIPGAGASTPNRTLVCYKEGAIGQGEFNCGFNCDPLAGVWTGLWRFGCEYAEDGCKPENALTGQMSWVEKSIALQVPADFKTLRFWRNTPNVATLFGNNIATLSNQSLGYEFSYEQEAYSSTYPSGRILMSSTKLIGDGLGNTILGKEYEHKLSLYRHSSGALVFGAGTIQWSWGLDNEHDNQLPGIDVSRDMQQATVNLLADMGVQPVTLQPLLVSATMSTDFTAPSAVITSPVPGANLGQSGSTIISGTITDVGGISAGVEISLDGGLTWRVATLSNGRTTWSYSWIPDKVGPITIKVRGFDDSGNMQAAGSSPAPNVIIVNGVCPCKIFPSPTVANLNAELGGNGGQGLVLGVKFRSSINGFITGLRFYKDAGNSGTHVGQLWLEGSTTIPLATATFVNETISGWQEVSLSTPVAITAGTTYVASYFSPNGNFSYTTTNLINPIVNGPLTTLAGPVSGNGVFRPDGSPAYPNFSSPGYSNYLVDVIFENSATCTVSGTLAPSGPICAGQEIKLKLTPVVGQTPYSVTLNNQEVTGIANNIEFGSGIIASAPLLVNLSIWPPSTNPPFASTNTDLRELGLKFRTSMAGVITGIRFFKSMQSGTGSFGVRLYDQTTGQLVNGFSIASVTINNTGVSGWQQANFSQPIAVEANKTYVASYVAPNGEYAETTSSFGTAVTNGPLTALANGTDGPNGVFKIGSGVGVPVGDGNSTNFWVDVVFTATSIIRFTQITDIYGVGCLRNNPNLQTLILQPTSCSALPVSLVDFKLSILENNVHLFWSTSSESNNSGFMIQRSTDGQNWSDIHFVDGAGNSQTVKKYEYKDMNLKTGKYFYRLKQIDFNGDYKYSKVITANINGKQIYMLSQNYPNPANQTTTISYSLPVKNQVDLVLYDMQGRQIKVLVHEVKVAGTHTIDLDTRMLGKGIYHYKMKSGNYSDVKRLLVE